MTDSTRARFPEPAPRQCWWGGGTAPLSGRRELWLTLQPGRAAGRTKARPGRPQCIGSDWDSSRRAGDKHPPTPPPLCPSAAAWLAPPGTPPFRCTVSAGDPLHCHGELCCLLGRLSAASRRNLRGGGGGSRVGAGPGARPLEGMVAPGAGGPRHARRPRGDRAARGPRAPSPLRTEPGAACPRQPFRRGGGGPPRRPRDAPRVVLHGGRGAASDGC